MKNFIKYTFSITITILLSYSILYAWNGLTASDWDTLNFIKWNQLVDQVTNNGKMNSLTIVDSTQEANLNNSAPLAALHIRTRAGDQAGIFTAWTPQDLTYPYWENFQVWERDGITFIERLRINWTTWNIWIWTNSPQEKLVVVSDLDADFDLSTSHPAQSSSIHIRRSHGTHDTPTIPTNVWWNWQQIWKIEAEVYNGSSYKDGAYIAFNLEQSATSTSIPTSMILATTPVNSTSASPRIHIQSNWNVWIWTSSPSTKLHVAWTITEDSDQRLKENIQKLEWNLDKIINLQWVTYNWKDTEKYNNRNNIWIIAQDLEKVYPELVHTNADGYKSVEYSKLVIPLLEWIKEQQKEIDDLKKEIENIKNSLKQ